MGKKWVTITADQLAAVTEAKARAGLKSIRVGHRVPARITELEERGVGVLTASPLSMGLLSHRGPPDWHPAPAELKEACARAAEHCSRRGADISKLAVQFSTSQERLASCIVGSADPENIRKNCRWIEEPLDGELLAEVLAIFGPVKDLCWYEGLAENSA